jgi:hypothetical protein
MSKIEQLLSDAKLLIERKATVTEIYSLHCVYRAEISRLDATEWREFGERADDVCGASIRGLAEFFDGLTITAATSEREILLKCLAVATEYEFGDVIALDEGEALKSALDDFRRLKASLNA